MSTEGMKAARAVRDWDPTYAKILAAELRNHVTPASIAASELGDEETAGDVRCTVANILRLADEMDGGR